MASQLDRLLGGWQGSTPEPVLGGPPVRGYGHEPDETNQVQIIVLHEAPPEPHPDSLAEKLVISVLSGGMSGRLFSEVREKRGLCYSVGAGYRGDRDFGSVSCYVGTTPERAQESLDVLLSELHRVHSPQGHVQPEEFKRAVTGMKSRLIFSGESTGARSAALAGDIHRLGRARSLEEMAGQIDALTLDQVNDYLARRSLGRMTIQTLGPKPLIPPR
jgi:predicted Zn-dependent peptidase